MHFTLLRCRVIVTAIILYCYKKTICGLKIVIGLKDTLHWSCWKNFKSKSWSERSLQKQLRNLDTVSVDKRPASGRRWTVRTAESILCTRDFIYGCACTVDNFRPLCYTFICIWRKCVSDFSRTAATVTTLLSTASFQDDTRMPKHHRFQYSRWRR